MCCPTTNTETRDLEPFEEFMRRLDRTREMVQNEALERHITIISTTISSRATPTYDTTSSLARSRHKTPEKNESRGRSSLYYRMIEEEKRIRQRSLRERGLCQAFRNCMTCMVKKVKENLEKIKKNDQDIQHPLSRFTHMNSSTIHHMKHLQKNRDSKAATGMDDLNDEATFMTTHSEEYYHRTHHSTYSPYPDPTSFREPGTGNEDLGRFYYVRTYEGLTEVENITRIVEKTEEKAGGADEEGSQQKKKVRLCWGKTTDVVI